LQFDVAAPRLPSAHRKEIGRVKVLEFQGVGKEFRRTNSPAYGRLTENLDQAVRGVFHLLRPGNLRKSGRGQAKRSRRFWALRDISFSVQEGEVVGIIGRNGAGKSTLLKILTRVTSPTTGRFGVRGRIGSLLEVGTGFHPELTGRENIYLNGAILGMSRAEIRRKFDEIVAFSEVEEFLDMAIKHYSSGMSVRLAFSVAAKLEPDILVVDEVLSVGDLTFQKKCLGVIEEVTRRGCTCLLVSHNLSTIIRLCQRALLLQGGLVVADGPVAEVVERYVASTQVHGGEIAWPSWDAAPGNDIVRLLSVRILQGEPPLATPDVDISKEVLIELTYQNLRADEKLYAAIWLKDGIGTPVLSTSSAPPVSLTRDAWSGCPHPPGIYQSICRIPGNFLNEGRYLVTAIIGRGIADTQILEQDILSFDVHDTGEMRGYFFGNWIGLVRPKLAWATEQMKSPPGPPAA
jgi:lipopolysaccharide transport system ATP-binding protein